MYHKKKKKCPVPNVAQLKNVLFASTEVVENSAIIVTKCDQYMTSLMK